MKQKEEDIIFAITARVLCIEVAMANQIIALKMQNYKAIDIEDSILIEK